MTRHVLLPVLLCSLVSLSVPVGMARAEEQNAQAEGRSHFRRGVDFFKEGDFRAALIEFKRAYELAPNYKVLYNIAHCRRQTNDYVAAWKALERYLQEGAGQVSDDRRQAVSAEIASSVFHRHSPVFPTPPRP